MSQAYWASSLAALASASACSLAIVLLDFEADERRDEGQDERLATDRVSKYLLDLLNLFFVFSTRRRARFKVSFSSTSWASFV